MFRRHTTTRVLGELEQAIMDVCWKAGSATVRDVLEALTRRHSAYTTVMTVMNRLVEKGYLKRKPEGNFFWYVPRLTKEEFQAQSSQRIIHELLTEYGDVAIAQFLATLGTVDRDKLRQFKQDVKRGRQA